ncbi:hypothetical protein [Undibacterium sp. TS12]|uniref:hypothetical protein n=1 Tax=Undibacterium sp. TS12 TaxID=2908202 RepID=UPI001F4CEBC8|nr:hypothetical protein [Undibacterium sp. TS12]MCH8619602.1 hypothetical protein [Undibacterium sp. TS12]
MSTLNISLSTLRQLLLDLKPAGPDGFEGLVACSLSELTGLVFRLAKSGSQFGRDASTGPAPFAIAMEAKRYKEKLTLDDLVGKAGIAGFSLENRIDLWVLAATSEVGDDINAKLHEILEKSGISLLTLDWSEQSLPHLAVLLAGARISSEAWFVRHTPDVLPTNLSTIFDSIVADSRFTSQIEQLRRKASLSEVGLDALRKRSNEWLLEKFNDRDKSQIVFGQYIDVVNSVSKIIPRNIEVEKLNDKVIEIQNSDGAPSLIAVLGEEGVGKTWVVAQWVSQLAKAPVVLFVAGRRTEQLDPGNPIESVAHLLSQQDGSARQSSIQSWACKLKRWQEQKADNCIRFVIVLDGLNEHAGKPWADILKSMTFAVAKLGGCVIATCRPAYWQREISARLGKLLVNRVDVNNYSQSDLNLIFKRHDIDPNTVAPKVQVFIRNPRVCSVAIGLLPQLDQPGALTIERLLLEYWRARLEERGDLIAHSAVAFLNLLRAHAREWIQNPNSSFDRDSWASRSPAVSGNHGRNYVNDLTEIEEGRFLQISKGDENFYEFKSETLPFAIGLLIAHELKTQNTSNHRELLDRILEPIRAFDLVSSAVTAATVLACNNPDYLGSARVALLEFSLAMQNPDRNMILELSHCVPSFPESFLDIVELIGSHVREDDILKLLLNARDNVNLQCTFEERIKKWLGSWSSRTSVQMNDEKQIQRQEEYELTISQVRMKLSTEENLFFAKNCIECEKPTVTPLLRAAAILVAGRRQANFSAAFLASRLAAVVAPDFLSRIDDLLWAVRLNSQDYINTKNSLVQQVDTVLVEASESMCQASVYAMRMLGDIDLDARADDLLPISSGERFRRVERYCNTDPYDTNSQIGSNIQNARDVITKIEAATLWNNFSQDSAEIDLEDVTPALARFSSSDVIKLLRDTIHSIEGRSQMPLRQLVWRLPELSPLFNEQTISSVTSTFERVINDPSLVQSEDFQFILNYIGMSLMPHLEVEDQLEILLKLPKDIHEFDALLYAIKPLSTERLEHYLKIASQNTDFTLLRKVLMIAMVNRPVLTECARRIIAENIVSSNSAIAAFASELVFVAEDELLNKMALEKVPLSNPPFLANEDGFLFFHERAIAAVVISQKRPDLVSLVTSEFIGSVACALEGDAYKALLEMTSQAVNRFTQPVHVSEPLSARVSMQISENGQKSRMQIDEFEDSNSEQDLRSMLRDLAKDNDLEDYAKEQREIFDQVKTFKKEIISEQAQELLSNLDWSSAALLVKHDKDIVEKWLQQILSTNDRRILRNFSNFGTVLAGVFAIHDGDMSKRVLGHLHDIRPFVSILVGNAQVSLYMQSLFKNCAVAELDILREASFSEALTDQELELVVISADACGAGLWLDTYMAKLLESSCSGEQARGLTIAGLRHRNVISEATFKRLWGMGFLGDVAEKASRAYIKNEWAYHWFSLAAMAADQNDFWRYGQLAKGVADRRCYLWFYEVSRGEIFKKFGDNLISNIESAAKKRTEKRKDTLFGLKAPDNLLKFALLN